MKNLNFLSNLCGQRRASQSTDVSLDCRLTVGSPSFHRRSMMLKLVSVLVLILTLGVGNAWAAEETLTIDYDSFSSHGTSYSDKSWSASTSVNHSSISGSGTVCFTNSQTYIQLKNGHPATRNTTALPGAIKSIAIKRQSYGNNRSVTIYVGTVALTNSNYTTNGTSLGSKTVTTDGVTWFLTPSQIEDEYTYFYIYGSSDVLYVDEIIITFDNGEAYDYELVTDASTLSAGDILVFANSANSAVASTFNTSNYLEKGSASISGTTLTTSAAMEFVLGGTSGSWTLTNGMNTLRATSTSALTMGGSSGVQTWTISISNNDATVAPSASYQSGTIRYNTGSPRFKNYTSGQAVIQIYKKLPCAAIDVTGGSAVILPAGSTTYSTGDWGTAGAPSSYAAEQTLPIGSNHYCVSFTQAYENNQEDGLQVKASDGIVSITDITSSYGIEVEILCSGNNGFQVELTGATTKTAQTGTVTISTTYTTADLTISKNTSNVGYIKYIKITPKAAPSCSNSVTLADNSPSNGTVTFSPTGPVETCDAAQNVTMTITPATGYKLSGWSTSGVSPSSTSPEVSTSGSASEAAQNISLTFAEDANGTYTASATFSQIMVTSLKLRAQQTDQSDKVGNNLTMTCYPKEGQTGGADPLNHTLKVLFEEVLPSNALTKTYTWSVRVKSTDGDWTNVGFTGNALNTNDIINSFNKSTGSLQIKNTEGTAEIKITADDGSGVTALVTITVSNVALTGVSVSPTEMEVYAGQKKPVTVTFTPVNATNKDFSAGSSYTYVTIRNKGAASFNIEGKSSITDAEHEETVTVTTEESSYTATVAVTVKPLPKVHFVDIIHSYEFSDVAGTIEDNALVSNKTTPTHDEFSGTGANTCETEHTRLVGWVEKTWADEHPNATKETMEAADSGIYFTAGATINVLTYNGNTYYAVWAKLQ